MPSAGVRRPRARRALLQCRTLPAYLPGSAAPRTPCAATVPHPARRAAVVRRPRARRALLQWPPNLTKISLILY